MTRNPGADVHFTPTPDRVVDEMLRISQVTSKDVIYDLGCGDGRILITAAHRYGAHGIGVDIDPALLADGSANARTAGVEALVEFRQQDLFSTDLSPASVITLYLLDSLNIRLRPRILSECQPGTRVVTYSFEMGEWEPDEYTPIAANGVMLWIVPANLSGKWVSDDSRLQEIKIEQKFQRLAGTAVVNGEIRAIREGKVNGIKFILTIDGALVVTGRMSADSMECTVEADGRSITWSAERLPGSCRPLEISASK